MALNERIGLNAFSEADGSTEADFSSVVAIRFALRYPEAQPSFRGAGLRAGIGNARDHPSSVDANQIEQVCSAVIDLLIDPKVERRPHHGQIVIDPDQWIMNAFFDLCRTGFTYALREGFKGHLRGPAVAHQHHRSTGQSGRLDRRGISF